MLDQAITRHAWRLRDVEQPTVDQLRLILPEDLVPVPDETASTDGTEKAAEPVENAEPAEPVENAENEHDHIEESA